MATDTADTGTDSPAEPRHVDGEADLDGIVGLEGEKELRALVESSTAS